VSLVEGYDLVIFDLDGVIYLIDKPIEGAADAVERLRSAGTAIAYATNNASRRAADVAALLTGMGVSADAGEVLTSAGAAAAMLAERLPAGANVLVVGAEALRAEVRDAGLTPVERLEDEPAAVVQGYGPQVGWQILAEASLAVRAGALWMATNTDRTLPSNTRSASSTRWRGGCRPMTRRDLRGCRSCCAVCVAHPRPSKRAASTCTAASVAARPS